MKKIFICSPLRGDIDRNIELVLGYCLEVSRLGHVPIAPHIYFTQFLDDNIIEERTLGMKFGMELLKVCDELWVFGDIESEGMMTEIKLANDLGIPVFKYSEIRR